MEPSQPRHGAFAARPQQDVEWAPSCCCFPNQRRCRSKAMTQTSDKENRATKFWTRCSLSLSLLCSYKNPTHRRTGKKAAKPKEVFLEQDQKKPKKTSTTRKETHKTKSRERQEALQNTSTVNCLFLAATDRRNKHKNTSSLLLHSFLPSSTYICLFFILVIFLHFIGGVFVEEFGLELLPRMMIRPSPTSIATPVRPTKQQNIHTTTKNSCRTPVHGTDTTD